jgi:hypothetical protein
MEGGIAILLLLVLVAIGAAFVFGFTSLGGALSLGRRKDAKDEAEDGGRPVHDAPTTPYHEHTRFSRPEDHEGAGTGAKHQGD